MPAATMPAAAPALCVKCLNCLFSWPAWALGVKLCALLYKSLCNRAAPRHLVGHLKEVH